MGRRTTIMATVGRSYLPLLLSFFLGHVTNGELFRTSCNQMAKFENPEKGFLLANHVLKTVNVERAFDCIVECLEHSSCQSINYKRSGNPLHVCELNGKTAREVTLTSNNDYVYYGPSKLNCSEGPGECRFGQCVIGCLTNDYVCECPSGTAGPTCEELIPPHDLVFPRASVQDYILLENDQEMENFTLLFRVNTVASTPIAILSYAVEGSLQELLVILENDKLIVTIQTAHSKTFYIPPPNDGYWHFFGIRWSKASYSIFVDGVLIYEGDGFGNVNSLKAGGTFGIGQKMNAVGGTFDSSVSFSGKLSQLNVWDKLILPEEIKNISGNCSSYPGTILDWAATKTNLNGQLVINKTSVCDTLRYDKNFDIVMSASRATNTVPTYAISPGSTLNMAAFTISLWVKHLSNFAYVQYVVPSTSGKQLSLKIHEDYRVFMAIAANVYGARIPRYWKENPAHWHHLAITWSNSHGMWKIFLDGSLVSIQSNIATGLTIPSGGTFVIGNTQSTPGQGMTAEKSLDGSMSRFNIWNYALHGEAIWAMTKGPLFENGNVVAWYGIKDKSFGNVIFEETPTDLYNSRYAADYQLKFTTKSTANYGRMDNAFPADLSVISACFWALFYSIPAGVLSYTVPGTQSEFMIYRYGDKDVAMIVRGDYHDTIVMEAYNRWHFYCFNWRSSDGAGEYFKDGKFYPAGVAAQGLVIRGGGVLIIGQETDSHASSFESTQAFDGKLTQLNFWDEWLTQDERIGMACGATNVNGNLLQWRNIRDISLYGNIFIENPSVPALPEYPLQKKRDDWCEASYSGTYARFFWKYNGNDYGYDWRCVRPIAMKPENMIFDIDGGSGSYFSRSTELLAITN